MSFILCGECGQQNSVTANHCTNCDANLSGMNDDRTDPFIAGTYLDNGRYLIQELLASGKWGRIYQGEDTSGEYEAIALRELLPPIAKPGSLDKIVQLLNSFIIQRSQFDHPQVAKFWQVFTEDGRLFLVGDLLQGHSYKFLLQQRQRQRQCFSEAEMIQLWQNILPILSDLHNQGVVHRYISPGNILKLGGDRVINRPIILSDCGGIQALAIKLMSPRNFTAYLQGNWGHIPRGKPGYAPEEQLQPGIVSPSSDLYALAVTSVVLMTGKPPHKLIDVFTMNWTWHRELNLTPVVKDCLKKMLSPEPGDRFQSAAELLDLIRSHPDIPMPILDPDENIAGDETVEMSDRESNPNVENTNPPLQRGDDPVPTLKRGVGGDRKIEESQSLSPETSQSVSPDLSPETLPEYQSSKEVPQQVKGWNWGAAILPGLWCFSNNIWLGLFAWVGFLINLNLGLFMWVTIGLIFGMVGNELAWKSRDWLSIEDFKKHQRGWVLFIGFIGMIFLISFGLLILMFI
jgi:serine/threonine protein kinase